MWEFHFGPGAKRGYPGACMSERFSSQGFNLARLFVAGFEGPRVPDEVAALIRQGLGGVILFSRNLPDLDSSLDLMEALFSLAEGRPLVISLDQEGGRVQRLGAPLIQLPAMGQLARLGDLSLCRDAGRQLGAELTALGFHHNLAPVLDVDSNPDNPVIGDRAFSGDPSTVIRFGLAFAEGLQDGGVANCVKHFPGHGDTHIDSHHDLPVLTHGMERLEAIELAPFRAATSAARLPDAILTAHVVVQALDPLLPASLSKATYSLLRQGMGYEGLVLTDDLEMAAVAKDPGVVEAACQALCAGADGALICHRPQLIEQAMACLQDGLERGQVDAKALAASVERWDRLAARVQAGRRRPERETLFALLRGKERKNLEARLQGHIS